MAEFRRDPHGEASHATHSLLRTVPVALLAAALWVAVPRYWPDEWTEPDEATRDRILLAVCGALAVIAAWRLADGLLHVVRWRRARRWERMLDDPDRAHLVPPLASHVRSVSRRSTVALAMSAFVLGAAAVALLAYGTLALTGRVPEPRSDTGEDQSVGLILVGLLVAPFAVGATRALRRRRVARVVERLSTDPSIGRASEADGDVAARRAAAVPALDVVFGGERAGPDPSRVTSRSGPIGEPLHVLFLRVFANETGTRLVTGGRWRRFGYVHLLRSADQVTPDELEAAKDTGTVASLFITTAEQLDDALRRQATGRYDEPRPHGALAVARWAANPERGRFPVRALLCHGTFWRTAVDLLLDRMDVVVLDLTGYRPQHTGTRFELQRVIDRFPIERVALVAEAASDRPFLVAQVRAAWAQMADGSPNAGIGSRVVHVAVEAGRR